MALVSATPESVSSKRPLLVNFGTEQTLSLFPTQVSTSDWTGIEHVLVQDLKDTALYQDFGAKTAAYVPLSDLVLPTNDRTERGAVTTPASDQSTPNQTDANSYSDITAPDASAFDEQPIDPQTEEATPEAESSINSSAAPETQTTPASDRPAMDPAPTNAPEPEPALPQDDEEPQPEPEPEPATAQVEPLSVQSLFVQPQFGLFLPAVGSYPLAQLSMIASTVTTGEAPAIIEAESEQQSVVETPAPAPTTVAPIMEASESEPVSVQTAEVPLEPLDVAGDILEDNAEGEPDTAGGVVSEGSAVETGSGAPADPFVTEAVEREPAVENVHPLPQHEITLSNFGTPPLEPGQFISGLQLRLSFAAQLKRPALDVVPYVEVLFGPAGSETLVGMIPLEDEVSNAINGGYFLFALPTIRDVAELSDMGVTVRYHGDRDDLDGMFLDAAWIELNTRTVTKDDLRARGLAGELANLKLPQVTTLVSDQVNFRRDENPLFNLRYNSQRNFMVRGLRNFIGRDLVAVESVAVQHRAFGPMNIEPILNVTKDGLLTIEIPDAALKNMRPGEYEIELTLNEGGEQFTDTFNFQWGILSTNPNKSEYAVGETAHISIGALTPNGNTVCEANLDLYVTDPTGIVSRYEVTPSGQCDGNNVIDVPDFSALVPVIAPGAYELYLERLSDTGEVLSFTTDTFNAVLEQVISIEREGPTRIYPPAMYPMTLTVSTTDAFNGTLTEVVPAGFAIYDTAAEITSDGITQTLVWELDLPAGTTKEVSYRFDAPDISPYLFTVGPARLDAEQLPVIAAEPSPEQVEAESASEIVAQSSNVFIEHRRWQIASDAVGNMILFWADGATIPTDWDCISCTNDVNDPFYQRFVMGSSTYNTTGGAATHSHTGSGIVANTTASVLVEFLSGTTIAANSHSHTASVTLGSASNLPEYRQLRVIQYTAAAGEPATIPAGAIAIFDVASSSLPSGWNRYAAQDGRYIYGENTPGTTGGSNTHTHTVTGTAEASTGAITRRGGAPNAAAINDAHTHSISGNTVSANNEPEYIEVVLGQITADGAPPVGMISMWTEDVPAGWDNVSADPGDPFSNRFIKPATSYGATGGASSHSHATTTITTGTAVGGTNNGRTNGASDGVSAAHTHDVAVTTSDDTHLPPYLTAVFGKRIGLDAVFTQLSYRWYTNALAQTPTDPWSSGVLVDLAEREPITATSTPVKDGDIVRLRLNALVGNATSTAGATFKLQYAAADICSAATGWADVGAAASSTIWRGHDNSGVADNGTLSSTTLASTTVAFTYQENGVATGTPSDVAANGVGEWDFVLEQNGATAGTNYCFRLVETDGTELFAYDTYPQLFTNEAPVAPSLLKLFDNEKTPSSTPWFTFVSTDAEGEKIHYEIEIDNNYSFASPEVQRDTIDDSSLFENQALNSDKAPFIQGQTIRFIPSSALATSTYYWRVRAQDPEGSGQWGEWSTIRSFTIDTTLEASAWFQTEDEQFDTNTLTGVETGGDQVDLITGSSTGTMISTPITFTDGGQGTAWDSLTFNDTETTGDLTYQIQYLDDTDTWTLIPDGVLSGNSTGFDTSPVNLLDLDVETYGVLRLVATFDNVGGSPSLQDWTLNWGYRVETPTITKLFPNEQTGTTTPTFQFTTTDPQSDSLTYQVEWSLTPDFAAPTTRTSGTDGGFLNLDNGADTDPFISGDDIQFTIQPADALTGTTTYWWRVRAKDTTGDDAWSFWTEPRSFTVIPGTEVSTWFQTTEEQFESNVLSGTFALATDAVTVATTASEAMIVYGEGTATAPRYRLWNGSAWSSEATMNDIGSSLRWAVVRAGTTREEYVAGTVGNDANLNLQVYATGEWSAPVEFTTSAGVNSNRGFDIAYETVTGDAMVVYCDGDSSPSYRLWNGSSWSIAGTATSSLTDDCRWVDLASDPNSDEIAMIVRGVSGSLYEVMIWNPTTNSWGNTSTFGTSRNSAYSGQAIAYESTSGDIMAVAPSPGGGPNRMVYNAWNGTTWTGGTTQTIDGRLFWAELASDPLSNEILLCYQNDNSDVQAITWSGTAWSTDTEFTATTNADTDPGFACVYDADNDGLGTYADGTNTNYRLWNGTAWGGAATLLSLGTTDTMQVVRTGTGLVLGAFFDGGANDSLEFGSWNGTSWGNAQTLETNMPVDSSPFGKPYFMAPRNSGSEGTTVVTPPLDFDDGLGPYWKTFSWNDTQPGSSEIRYSLQYYTASGTWAFIPNADLPGNETGTTTGPYDLSDLNTNTYNIIRPYAVLSCDGSGNCPQIQDWKIEWAGGITISGTIAEYDQVTNVTAGTVAVAVNGVLQTGKTGTISAGAWSIDNVTVFPGDIVTVFVNGANDANEAVGVARYDGQGDMDGVQLFERHLSLGSNDATSTPITNVDIGLYDLTNTEDVFFSVTGTTLDLCVEDGCSLSNLYVRAGTSYSPSGRFVTHDFQNNGIFTAGSFTHEVAGSWLNVATTTMTGSTIVFSATSTTESIESISSFNNITLGTTTGSGTWTLSSALDANGALTVSRGTLARGTTSITVAGNLVTGVNGFWTGIGTTTFDGGVAASWSDQNASLQNVGRVVVDGANKIVTLAGNVAAQSITIGANDTLDASTGNRDITVYGTWTNNNNFLPRSGEVFFAATTSGQTITTAGDAFFDLSFTGIGGGWSFTEATLLVNNNFTVATGTVTLPTGTTTIAGSFDATGGSFAHNNGTLRFTANNARTITFDGGLFTNVVHNLVFDGGGSWIMTDTNATTTNDLRVAQGTVTFPSGVLAIGGTLTDTGGTFVGGTGTVRFYSSVSEVITAGGSSFGSIVFDGTGDWSFADTNVDAGGDLLIQQGTLTLPSGNFTVAGSYANNSTVVAGSGTVTFDAGGAGETIDFGASALYNVVFNNSTGGWTIVSPATTTNDLTLTGANDWTLAAGQLLSVGGVFTNSVGGASTTWTGSTLSLESGQYSINTKNDDGDVYGTLRVADAAQVKMWNSRADAYVVGAGSLYSQDHDTNDGDLYIWGAYENAAGAEYWSYATDFDGADLTGFERPVSVRFASGASAQVASSTFEIIGISTASTTIANQGAGTYTLNITGGTTTARYYEFADLGATGVSLTDGVVVPLLRDGSYTVAANGGTALTLSSTTIDANPGKQIFNVTFATTTAIAATNVTQTDGAPLSYWWFRNGHGNLYGENFDNDTGDPGSVRFDDSSLVITVAGTVYSDAGVTPITGGTCDGVTPVVRVMINDTAATTVSCSAVDGSYSAAGLVVIGDPTITVYLDGASGGERGSATTRTPTTNILDMDIYANRVIVRNEDTDPLTIPNLALFDNTNDTDLQFVAATSTGGNTLNVLAGNELYVFASSTFTPGGVVTLAGNAAANSYDGTLYLAGDATFNAYSTSTVTIGGRLELATGATFNAASTTVLMNATTTGKSITAPSEITFNNLTFNGVGGGWNLGADIRAEGDITITNGTVTGTGDIYLENGSLTGNGTLSLGGGTTTVAASNTLGGTTPWTFFDLTLGDTFQVGTTTPVFTSTTTVSGRLTINAAHYLDAGSTTWDLSGAGTVFVEDGTFLEDTSTIRYSGAGATILSTQYYNLDINAGAGSPTYTLSGGAIVDGDLTVGGDVASTLDLNTNDPLMTVAGDVLIRSNGTVSASDSNDFTIGGSYDNNGTFTSNSGTLTFNGAGTIDIAAGSSDFASVLIAATGDVTVSEHATATDAFTLASANTFTLSSGRSLAVAGTFFNAVGGAATTWTDTTLRLYGGGNYSINAATTSDSYSTLTIGGNTQIRMWNSDAVTYDVAANGSLYSQDHEDVPGDLYIWGSYVQTAANDHWSYATDFDGTALGGSSRKVDVFLASGASVQILGGTLAVYGGVSASTTIQNQGAGSYGLLIGGTASTSLRYYELRDLNAAGLTLTGTPAVATLSYGDIEVSSDGGTAMTVGGTVITQNPAKTFTQNRFALNGAATGFNVTATGTSLSSWRFANHYGDIDGESFDVDPDGDPGYVAWDDSATLITVAGRVYSDEGSTVSGICDGTTNNVHLRVAGITSYTTSCNASTGAYSISNVAYGPTNSLVVYIDGEAVQGASATKEPVSNINGLDIYEDRVIIRHENIDPHTIADLAVWDSSDDADIPFTAIDGSPDTLTLPADTKLIVWNNKEFAPGGNVTLSGGGAGAAYDGTLELRAGATWTGAGTESLSIGGSFLSGAGAVFSASNGTTTFTTTGSGRTIDVNEDPFTNVVFTGSGSWSVTGPTFTANGYFRQTAGTLTFGGGTTTISGSFVTTGGSFTINNSPLVLSGAGTHTYTFGGSNVAELTFAGGTYTPGDTNATATQSVRITSGSVTLPSGTFAIGGDFTNEAGTITHNTSELIFTSATTASVTAASSDLYALRFTGGGAYELVDEDLALLDDLIIDAGSLTLASGTLSIGGSFDASGGTFDHASGTVLFNGAAGGNTIDAGSSPFYNVQVSAPSGGYTITANATTTNNFALAAANSFTVQSGTVLTVGGVFLNTVGGADTTWSGSTLKLSGANAYTVNTKASGGDQYDTLSVGPNSDIRLWNSAATTTIVDPTSSVYSQDNAGVDGALNIYGDFHISTTTEYWSYATDFDGTSLTGSERAVTVAHASGATTTVDGGTLRMVGVSGNETTVTNQGSGTYALAVQDGTFLAQYYAFRNLNARGLDLSGTPVISSLAYGDYELAVNGGTLISLSSTTLNANASLVIAGARFATTTAITGANVTLTGSTSNAWTFTGHTGNLDGEDYDVDGATACGSVRWADSACLITQQTNFRWRADDGGLGVPDSEWYDVNWGARTFVRVLNADATSYTDAAVQLLVTHDSDMQPDFDDLRFTAGDGLTLIPHWVASSTDNTVAEVWVKVPTLAAESTTDIYMYFDQPTATTTSSSTAVFSAADDFDDGNITEYSGETADFTVDGTFAYSGAYALDATGNETGRTESGGVYRLDQTVSVGQTIRYLQYIDTVGGATDEVCTKFGIQSSGAPGSNYAVCTDLNGPDRLVLVRNGVDNADTSPAVTLDSKSISVTSGWHTFEVDWATGSIAVAMYDDTGALVATTSSTDSNYSSGGFGFSFWFQHGGWDNFTARPTLSTEPTITFGVKQSPGGASWLAAQNTPVSVDVADTVRLRLSIENSGLAITDQEFRLEYAALGAAPSCEAVGSGSYTPVLNQANCANEPICMQTSTNVTNGAATIDLLSNVRGLFTPGEAREDPTNTTGLIDIDQNEYTELEYVITPTTDVTDENLCFRVTDAGDALDTYLKVARLTLKFDPVLTDLSLNNGENISLLPGTTTAVYATGTVSDLNGYTDILYATTTYYRSGVAGGAACTPDNNNCYITSTNDGSCAFTACAGESCTIECRADIFFHADPTATSTIYEGEVWYAFVEVEDSNGGYDFGTPPAVELEALRAISASGAIDYGALAANEDTGSFNASTSIANEGNVAIDIEVIGTDLSDGLTSSIDADLQKFATSTFTYSGCGALCKTLSSTTPVDLDVELDKPTTTTPPIVDEVYWGIRVPIGVNSVPHQGINYFTPISP